MSSDYIDALELEMKPEEGDQYFVVPFIQEIFGNVVKVNRLDIAEFIILETTIELQ